jgi:hypothetical protein
MSCSLHPNYQSKENLPYRKAQSGGLPDTAPIALESTMS